MAKTGAIDKYQVWSTPLGERPAGPPLVAGDWLLVPTHLPTPVDKVRAKAITCQRSTSDRWYFQAGMTEP